ncbi:MAG: nodulation protein NfeD [Bacteroidales bacterium]|nr:nodulation protein NfeD [Bacteroidales bacterium]
MKKKYFLMIFVFVFVNTITNQVNADDIRKDKEKKIKVFKFDIKEEIAPPIWRKTKNAFQQAKDTNADLILIHMNTYGGMLDAADSIRTIILHSKIPVYVFIDNNAASAGALISIACDSIYMRSGANIGAATVVDQTGKPLPDKYQSYMRSMMRSTAEAKGRDPEIAQAMVDPRIYIENISDTGNVLTFTTSEAIKNGYCEGKAENVQEVLIDAGLNNYEIIEQKLTSMDKFIGFLINPMISGVLIMIIIGGIYFELQSPGVGFPIVASIIAALLYFAPHYVEGLANNWEILIFIIGVILVAVEIFVIPGFGVAGIAGIMCIIIGLTLSMVQNFGFDFTYINYIELIKAFFIVIIATFVSLILSFYLSKKIFTSTVFGQLALASTQQVKNGFTSADAEYSSMIGKFGYAKTILRPAGKVEIGGEIFDATAESGFIDEGKKIEVIRYETGQLFVRKT